MYKNPKIIINLYENKSIHYYCSRRFNDKYFALYLLYFGHSDKIEFNISNNYKLADLNSSKLFFIDSMYSITCDVSVSFNLNIS